MTRNAKAVRAIYRARYGLGLALIAFAVLTLLLLSFRQSSEVASRADQLELISTQKALSQRISFLANSLAAASREDDSAVLQRQLEDAVVKMRGAHGEFLDIVGGDGGGELRSVGQIMSDPVEPLARDINYFLDLGEALANGPGLNSADLRLQELNALGANSIMQAYDILSRIVTTEARRDMRRMGQLQVFAVAMILIIMAAEVLLIFETFGKRIETAIHQAEVSEAVAVAEAERSKRADAAKSNFLRVFSHEVRTPLNAILGMAEILKSEPLAEGGKDFVEDIHNAGQHMLALANDILLLNQVDADRISFTATRTNLCELVGNLCKLLGHQAQEQGLKITYDIETLPPVLTDSHKVRQVLYNIMGNALKFTDQGGLDIRLSKDDTGGEPKVSIDVVDTGPGIPENKKEAIFAEFEQVAQPGQRVSSGAGLGLAISRRIAAGLGGDLVLVSSSRAGSHFRLTLPFRPAEEEEEPKAEPAQPAARETGERIIVADDIRANRLVLSTMMRAAGFEILEAADGREAIELTMAAEPPAAILMDIEMPQMNGMEATERLRAQGYSGAVVAVTAHVLPEDHKTLLGAGFDAVVTKPVSRQELLDILGRLGRERHAA